MSARSEACSTVIAQILPLESTSSIVFSSRSRVSATGASRNPMNNVSVLEKYRILMARSLITQRYRFSISATYRLSLRERPLRGAQRVRDIVEP